MGDKVGMQLSPSVPVAGTERLSCCLSVSEEGSISFLVEEANAPAMQYQELTASGVLSNMQNKSTSRCLMSEPR